MKSFAISALFTLASAVALPQSTPNSDLTNPLICRAENFVVCETYTVAFDTCQVLPAPEYKNVGSFKPAAGSYCRITYTHPTCTPGGDAFIFDNAPAAALHTNWTDPATGLKIDAGSEITSFECQRWEDSIGA